MFSRSRSAQSFKPVEVFYPFNNTATAGERLPYPVCNVAVGGLSIIDLCIISALAYEENETYAYSQLNSWLKPAGANVSIVSPRDFYPDFWFSDRIAVRVINIVPPERNGTFVVAIRGTASGADFAQVWGADAFITLCTLKMHSCFFLHFAQDVAIWNDAALFQLLGITGLCKYAYRTT